MEKTKPNPDHAPEELNIELIEASSNQLDMMLEEIIIQAEALLSHKYHPDGKDCTGVFNMAKGMLIDQAAQELKLHLFTGDKLAVNNCMESIKHIVKLEI